MSWKPTIRREVYNGEEHLIIDESPPPAEPVRMVMDPNSGDGWRAIDVLEEIQRVLTRRGFAMVHKPDGIRLARITDRGTTAVRANVVAHVRMIAPLPFGIEWKDL